ncbi:MAG: aminotransferase class I/II-fold pyridoxal phosphate-dependent enzyme [Anaerolineae bacterium]|nr:aminotransferase class I/II-fold pyridoxal phosphate-dependent enzyme [Anaerolineae bacterium]
MYKFGQEELEAIGKVIEAGWLFRYGGEPNSLHQVEQFEQKFAARMQSPYAVAVTGGTAALVCALVGLGIGPGDEVIVPGYTFIATAAAVVEARAVPVIVEIDETLTLDVNDVRRKITPHTKAIIPVHMAGIPCNLDPLLELAREHNLYVIEDACQAVGGAYKGRPLDSLGDAGAFSLNFYKIIGVGEGGVAVTQNRAVYDRMRMHHDCGVSFWGEDIPEDKPVIPGINYRMNEVLGAFALVQLGRLDSFLAGMRPIKQRVHDTVAGSLTPAPTNDLEGDCGTTLHFQFDTVETAARFEALLNERNLGAVRPINTGRHIYANWEFIMNKANVSPQWNVWGPPHYTGQVKYAPDMCPRTLDITARTVALDTNPFWTESEVNTLLDHLFAAARTL